MSIGARFGEGRWLCSASLLAVIIAGCNQSKYPLVSVSGTVTFDGEKPPKSGSVTLQPLEIAPGLPKRPATGNFDVSGNFTVNTFTDHKGVLPGRYRVEVTCFAGAPDPSQPDPWGAVDYIAEDYEPTELTIEPDSSAIVLDIDVPRRDRPGS